MRPLLTSVTANKGSLGRDSGPGYTLQVGPGNGCVLTASTSDYSARGTSGYSGLVIRLYGVSDGGDVLLAEQRGPTATEVVERCLARFGGMAFDAFKAQIFWHEEQNPTVTRPPTPATRYTFRSSHTDACVGAQRQLDFARQQPTKTIYHPPVNVAGRVMVVGANADRRRVLVAWQTPEVQGPGPADYVVLCADGNTGISPTFPLLNGSTYEFHHTAEIWAEPGSVPGDLVALEEVF